jgi:hypothetical protein
MAKDGKKKKEKRPVEEDEEEAGTGDLPLTDTGAEERAEARKKKKKQKVVVDEEPPVDELSGEEEEEAPVEENPEDAEKRLKNQVKRSRKKKKLTGYRLKAQECGFTKNSGIAGAGGEDMFASAITSADAKRLMRFVPEVLKSSSYDKAECAARMALSLESVPDSAARVTQAHCEAVLRDRAKAAVMLTLEKGVSTVDAATMQSVLRPYQYNMTFSSVLPPKGLIRHAQTNAVLGASAADLENADQEKEDNAELASAARKIEKAEAARKEAFHKHRADLKKAREAVV